MNKLSGHYIELAQRIEKKKKFPQCCFWRAGDGEVRNEMRCRADGALHVSSAIAGMCLQAGRESIHGWLVSNTPVGWLLRSNTAGRCWCGDGGESLPPLRQLKTGEKHNVSMFGHRGKMKSKMRRLILVQWTNETWNLIWFVWLNMLDKKRLLLKMAKVRWKRMSQRWKWKITGINDK